VFKTCFFRVLLNLKHWNFPNHSQLSQLLFNNNYYLCFKSNLILMKQSYIPKDLTFDNEGRSKLIKGISKISKAVKSTLGPRGRTVLIESPEHLAGITVTKDGVTVANSIFLDDPIENLAIQMMKDAASRTAQQAGDGTTTAIVLTEAIVNAGETHLTPEHNVTEVIKYINKFKDNLIDKLEKGSKKITKSRLLDVATISANNDKEIGSIIADAYKKVGNDGIVTVEKSMNHETYAEVTNGIKVDRGYTSNLFLNNQRKDECIMEDVMVLVCDQEINNILQIENVLKPIIQQNKKLLMIAPCSANVINTLAANVVRNGLQLCNIVPPNFGFKSHELMQDIAFAVGAKYYSEKTGDDLSLLSLTDLGHVDKIIVGKTTSVLIKDAPITQETTDRIAELREQQEATTFQSDRDFINERIASLAGAIGCIYVGGNSDIEQKEKFDRVDDSVCAVRSAMQEGIITGGGLALFNTVDNLSSSATNSNQAVAFKILKEAVKVPLKQIIINSGKNPNDIIVLFLTENPDHGYDVKNEKMGDMFKMGVIDPLKVTKNALINAVSVATTILSTNAIVTHARAQIS
jgi:chaperonin GroEL